MTIRPEPACIKPPVPPRPKLIYIASAYTSGPTDGNVRRQHFAAARIFDLGHLPIIPLLLHYQSIYQPLTYDQCLAHCLRMVEISDILLRLPGHSPGADTEEAHASTLNIPIFHSLTSLRRHLESLQRPLDHSSPTSL